MTEPSLALQTAIRDRLITTPAVAALVPAAHIRDGRVAPEQMPAILFGTPQTVLAGRTGAWRQVWVYLDLHVWALESGTETVRQIGNEIDRALIVPLDVPGFELIPGNFSVEGLRAFRDPDGKHGHGVMTVSALLGEFF